MTTLDDKKYFMQLAISEAKKSDKDIPVGCVIVENNKALAGAHNLREKNNDISAHAEILALKKAGEKKGNWRLDECDLYVTLEPCPMCAWAILNARIKNVYFASYDNTYGAFGSKINLSTLGNYKTKIHGGILEEECNKLIKDYFAELRK